MSTSGSANRLSTLARLVAVSDVLPAHARGAGHTTATGRHSGATVTDGGSCDILGTHNWCCEITFTLCKRDKAR